MLIVPLKPLPNQTLSVLLSNQSCQINVYQKAFGLYFDLYVSNKPVICGVICQNINRIVRSLYFGFSGDFWFKDVQGSTDPVYTGLGSRYILEYIEPTDLPAGIG